MAEHTGIAWANSTWNIWRGCQKVSEECDACYAEAMSRRNPEVLGEWGPGTRRAVAADAYWNLPFKWDRAAELAGERRRVFLGSLMDFNEDRPDLDTLRRRAWLTIGLTLRLDYLILTKRPERFPHTLPPNWGPNGYSNVWLGTTVGVARWMAERTAALTAVPARVRFLSCEPLLEDCSDALRRVLTPKCGGDVQNGHVCAVCRQSHRCPLCQNFRPPIQWVIIGGESNQGGQRARPFNVRWAEKILAVCREAGVAAFVKQAGDNPCDGAEDAGGRVPLRLTAHHGGDPIEWPAFLRVRQVPGQDEEADPSAYNRRRLYDRALRPAAPPG